MKLGVVIALGGALLAGSAWAGPWDFTVPPPTPVRMIEAGASPSPVSLAKVVVRMNLDQQYGVVRFGVICEESTPVQWKRQGDEDNAEVYRPVFHREFAAAGLKAGGDPANLFEGADADGGDLAAGLVIRNVRANFCARSPVFSGPDAVSGKLLFDGEWQIYSRLRRQVVARVNTSGGHVVAKGVPDGLAIAFQGAFAEHVRQLIASEEFRNVVTAPISLGGTRPGTPISYRPAPAAKRTVASSAESVAAVFSGDGHGTGFLISSDGYLLTNHHVVGEAKYVKVRWPDRSETVGEVVRSDRRRDIALVKVDATGRRPLVLRTGAAAMGETVYAVGTPIDQMFQGTVTKGIVSANRTYDGLSYIQSDVTVNGGNSGGPLLDEGGAVLGVTVWGVVINGAPAGLNLFIPIGDALDTLALKPAA